MLGIKKIVTQNNIGYYDIHDVSEESLVHTEGSVLIVQSSETLFVNVNGLTVGILGDMMFISGVRNE